MRWLLHTGRQFKFHGGKNDNYSISDNVVLGITYMRYTAMRSNRDGGRTQVSFLRGGGYDLRLRGGG